MRRMKPLTTEKRRALSAKLGISDAYLYQCLRGLREMNPIEARRIELASKGLIKREMICQKTWQGIWPELVKRQPVTQEVATDER
jgi:DNA-binding transcriptional regulator YdaS (Cro superfamily)